MTSDVLARHLKLSLVSEQRRSVQTAGLRKHILGSAQFFRKSVNEIRFEFRIFPVGQFRRRRRECVDRTLAAHAATGCRIEMSFEPLEIYIDAFMQVDADSIGIQG